MSFSINKSLEKVQSKTGNKPIENSVQPKTIIKSKKTINKSKSINKPRKGPIQSPETPVHSPETSVQSPETYVQSPETTVQSPETTVQSPETPVQLLEIPVQSSEATVQSAETSVQSPETTVQSPETTVQSPGATVQSPETTVHPKTINKPIKKSVGPKTINKPIKKTIDPKSIVNSSILAEKQQYKDNIVSLCNEIATYTKVVVVGKGPSAQYIAQQEPSTFYVGIKQAVQFLKDTNIDLFVFTDLSGLYGIEHLLKKIRYILCPFYPHGYNLKPRLDIDYNYVSRYVAEHDFTGKLCFVQIGSDLNKDSRLPVYKVNSSGDLFFHICCKGLKNKNITAYGINKGVGYHPDMIKLVQNLSNKTVEQKRWSEKYLANIKSGSAAMVKKNIYSTYQSYYKGRYKDLQIQYL